MKRLIKLILCGLLAAMAFSLQSCRTERKKVPQPVEETPIQLYEKIMNPEFTTVADLWEYYQLIEHHHEIDSTFRSIPPDIVATISQVIIGRNGKVTKTDVVSEYYSNYDSIYKHIRPIQNVNLDTESLKSADTHKDTLTIKEEPKITKDTVINGEVLTIIKQQKDE